MSEEWEQQERAERNSDRSQEAHWRAAEAGAEEENRRSEEDPRRDDQEDDWETREARSTGSRSRARVVLSRIEPIGL